MVQVIDMEMEQELENQYIYLMLRASNVIPQSLPPPEPQLVPSEQGGVFLLNDDLDMDVYNLEFNESWQRIVKARRK